MKTIQEIRKSNFKLLASEYKSYRDFAAHLGKAESYVNNILSPNNIKNIGESVARDIEVKCNKPIGWMDNDHSNSNTAPAPDLHLQVPLLGKVSAGAFIHTRELESHEVETWLMSPKDYHGRAFGLRIEGDSMTSSTGKSYPEGSIAVFDSGNKQPENGALVLAKVNGSDEVTFKKFVTDAGSNYLMPLNPNYPRIDKEFRVLAVFEYAIVY